MMKKELKIVEEFYDISRYIGIVDPNHPIYESYQGEGELIALTRSKLLTVGKDGIDLEVNLRTVKTCSFSPGEKNTYRVEVTTNEEVISLFFKERRESLRFTSNILKGLI